MQIQPYLFFDARCQKAIYFCRQSIGAEVLMQMCFKDSPNPAMVPPGVGDGVMHACLRIGDDRIFLSDGMGGGAP